MHGNIFVCRQVCLYADRHRSVEIYRFNYDDSIPLERLKILVQFRVFWVLSLARLLNLNSSQILIDSSLLWLTHMIKSDIAKYPNSWMIFRNSRCSFQILMKSLAILGLAFMFADIDELLRPREKQGLTFITSNDLL